MTFTRRNGRPAGRSSPLNFSRPKPTKATAIFLEKQIPALLQAKPDYCSVTYGAGGSTRDKTLMIVDRIQRQHGLTALAHLTCVNHTREQVRELLEKIRSLGCKNILALRGDPPGGGEFQPTPGGFEFAAQLVQFIRESGDFSIGVAGFPEGHVACKDGKHADWRHLKEKVDAGADFVLTQLFFDNADYFEFRDYVAGKLGVRVPLVPGIISILSAAQITKFTQLCGAKIPPPLRAKLDQLADQRRSRRGIWHRIRHATVRGIAARGRAGTAFLHAEQITLHRAGLEKSRSGVMISWSGGTAAGLNPRKPRLTSELFAGFIGICSKQLVRHDPDDAQRPWSSKLSAILSSFCSESLAFL